jgi:hypothetical protein
VAVGGVVTDKFVVTSAFDRDSPRRGIHMTGLGATIYFGLFAIAALWLFLTSDRFSRGQAQRPERSNSWSAAVDSDGSSPWLVSHPASK